MFPSTAASEDLDAVPVATKAPEIDASASASASFSQGWEQQSVLEVEEPYWHKSIHKPRKEGDDSEQIWLKNAVIDPRIGERMRRFELTAEEEERARRIASGSEKTRAIPVQDLRSEKVKLGNVDEA